MSTDYIEYAEPDPDRDYYNYGAEEEDNGDHYVYTSHDNTPSYKHQQLEKKFIHAYNSMDKDYRVIMIGEKYNQKEVGIYSTNDYPGTIIKNALTGARMTPFRVGSPHEHLFFKVKLALNGMASNSDVFFFDSPEEFERQLQTIVGSDQKERWTNKFVEIKAALAKSN